MSPVQFSRRAAARVGAQSCSFIRKGILAPACALLLLLLSTTPALAQLPGPPWTFGQSFTNPVTSASTTISGFINDPAGTPTAGNVAFVRSADGYVFLVKNVGEIIYNSDSPPIGFEIIARDNTAHTAELKPAPPTPAPAPPRPATDTISTQMLYSVLQTNFIGGTPAPPVVTPPILISGSAFVRQVQTGDGGDNGRNGALFVPPDSGSRGDDGPSFSYTNNQAVSATNHIGLEIASIGGTGGEGGDSYASFWDGENGGDGGSGGNVTGINGTGIQVATTGADAVGMFVYSRSGAAGNGGSGYGAPNGGIGGHSSDAGNVVAINNGNIVTNGLGAYGLQALSVSGNGGNGGDQWGIVGSGGDGAPASNGGNVTVTNNGTILTQGAMSHGILAQSIGGTGGSSGSSSNLLVSLDSQPDNGGDGKNVSVTNNGGISTTNAQSRGIWAQSVGGGGGSGRTSSGLIALGGSGANGGKAGQVTVTNSATGTITTSGVESDGIFAQSVGGSGGSGADGNGLFGLGGKGANAGDGDNVIVSNLGIIATTGNKARGVVAESIGGGGGDGGNASGMVAVGGSGDGGGNSGTVTVTQGGRITTEGNEATGIFAQAVGGGGGNGGSSGSIGAFAGVAIGGTGAGGGTGGNVTVNLQGQNANTASLVSTLGDRSSGVFAQSVGGGGGNGGGAVQATFGVGGAASVAIGGNGGGGGNAGTVAISNGSGGQSVIQTAGDDSSGVFIQSVGGGGGNGGYAVAVAVSGGPVSGSLAVSVGGKGGTGGEGGAVQVGTFNGQGDLQSTGFNGTIQTGGDRSTGFVAQSVGGGGGNGGLAVAGAASASLLFDGSISVGVGGQGGGGGSGGTVNVGTQGNITTTGAHSTGMLVQSVGGGGGNGGGTIAATLSASGGGAGAISVGVGGDAGNGRNGGAVTVATRAGNVSTQGESSSGIVVQSIGGGGGNGGYSVAAGLAVGTGAGSVNVGLGGKGGTGSSGGTVKADLESNVSTAGESSTGVLVQSVGGGGGNGGFSVAAGGAGGAVGSGAVSVGLGGGGGAAGAGGNVEASSAGTITTQGDNSSAFVAQSIGGGGGNGGFSVSGTLSAAGVGSGAVSVGLGGNGGAGGLSGTVIADTSGNVLTHGDRSTGVLAQSVGGGGGNGGFNVDVAISAGGVGSGAIGVGLGGTGGAGANGNTVNLTVANNVTTEGRDSAAVVAQSIGGGGGNGGINVTVAGSGAGTGSGAVGVGLGGSGAGGGTGNTVVSAITGNLLTKQDGSTGSLAQSVGGGGGNGGLNVSAAISVAGTGSAGAAVGLGGSAGTGGAGGLVTSTVIGNIGTVGNRASGAVAQSLGGGGGNGGVNISGAVSASGSASGGASVGLGGAGGTGGGSQRADLHVTGDVGTQGDESNGVLAQSIGGGGGNGGLNISGVANVSGGSGGAVAVGLGGSGGGGGAGGEAEATLTGDVATLGAKSNAVTAQSIGGGGGSGGVNISGALTVSGSAAGSVSVGLGGSGGSGGLAQSAKATLTGDAATVGDNSYGVLAQSVGGGGGTGGLNIAAGATISGGSSGTVSVGLGGSGGSGGIGGAAETTVTGDVTTLGKTSNGITAQSIGGGGGAGGINISGGLTVSAGGAGTVAVGLGGSGGTGGRASTAKATVTGNTTTVGDNSHGVLAQSVGGGGGNGGMNISGGLTAAQSGSGTLAVGIGGAGGGGGQADAVTGTVTGKTITTGNESYGVFLQSLGGGGGNGGMNVSGGLSLSKSSSGTAAVGVGGFGGSGGNASSVTGTVTGDVGTSGDKSIGVLAQSVGGGGGNGGMNISGAVQLSTGTAASAAIGVGGFGGGGGNSGIVELTRTGGMTITTGANADGVVAQSIGGGGGNGGMNISGALAGTNNGSSFTAAIGVGGFGGSGGKADEVRATVIGDVRATGLESDTYVTEDDIARRVRAGGSNGVLAQSVGGSGGNGGMNVSGGIAIAPPSSGHSNALNLGVGGFGGSGGDAGKVTLDVTANAVTSVGDDRFAVGAQSLGGGGGNGGINVSGGVVIDGQITAGVGGFGGAGGKGESVDATATTNIVAAGDGAIGFMAQSIGGGGGNGGVNISGGIQSGNNTKSSSLVFGLGGSGGAGNISGAVIAAQTGNIQVEGTRSIGVLAQSIAGGGGNGALNVSGNAAIGKGYSAAVGIGGSGGAGANAGAVSLTSDGLIQVDGRAITDPADTSDDPLKREALNHRELANGILAQSVGGGGGNGGMNVAGVLAPKGSPLAVGVGGSGSGGGDAGAVSVVRGAQLASVLTTKGNNANGLTAQSIGGGGGNAGMNFVVEAAQGTDDSKQKEVLITIGGAGGAPGHGNTVDVTQVGDIGTEGNHSDAILAQSVGGGGGNANINFGAGLNKKTSGFDLVVGGAPGDGGNGAKVTVDHTGNIATQGKDSTGIFAQSVGGGGGNAEAEDSAVADHLTAPEVALDVFSDPKSSVNVSIGRKGGTGGIGGDVSVALNGTLATLGDKSVGILAQSVGNSGGVSGTTSVAYSAENEVAVQLGLEGGIGGHAGNVDVTTTGAIGTVGADAHAIHAQSVGGGGGVGGAVTSALLQGDNSMSVGLGGTGGTGGVAGSVRVDNNAFVTTQGDGSHGIYAQSIGGGGGEGGFAGVTESEIYSAAVDTVAGMLKKDNADENKGSTRISALVGGHGGTGAVAGTVDVTNTNTIVTTGRESYGINATSVGGGGGDGGMVVSGNIAGGKSTKAFTINVGGDGGDGGAGKAVSVTNEGLVHTTGNQSIGIRAQSVGGGGGDAGLLANLSISAIKSSSSSASFTANIGGKGGKGGTSGDVTVTNQRGSGGTGGDVLTEGDSAHGVFAQSLGGGGGNGSSIVSANFAGSSNSTVIGLNIGGNGGEGGTSGNVTVTNASAIETRGNGSDGVFAQSIGGGGGNGGLALATNGVVGATSFSSTPLVTLGGSGGTGEHAGDVTVTNSGTILTHGNGSNGILAQSIGGGGGNAGIGIGLTNNLATTAVAGVLSAAFGGSGGDGGQGGSVTVHHSGDITVLGNNSRAVVAESINGGGGHVALDFNGITSLPGGGALPDSFPSGIETKPVFVFNGGGDNVKSTNAGKVTLDYTGTFGVAGNNGAGNSVQAVGGGGGTFDVNVSIRDASTAAADRVSFQGTLGGKSGHDNAGGDIESSHSGELATTGANTPGIFMQSVGGGGGRANVDVTSESGALGASSFALGGTNGANESGGDVTHAESGSITTTGAASHGAVIQSVGGGGGALSYRLQQSTANASALGATSPNVGSHALAAQGPEAQGVAEAAQSGDAASGTAADEGFMTAALDGPRTAAATAGGAPVAVTLGSSGGAGLNGGAIGLGLSGDTITAGASATGLILQSIGAGGGTVNVMGASDLAVTLGGSAGASGNGGDLEVTNAGAISTAGSRAHGIFLQSVGGGGAAVFTDVANPTVTLSSDNTGSGGSIRFTQTGNISTAGDRAYGLFAQSVGGGGGFVDGAFAGTAGGVGAGGAITLKVDGNIDTTGAGSTALFAQSAGSNGGSDIHVSLTAGHRIVGSADGVAVALDGGASNVFENRGSVMTLAGITGQAFRGSAGGDFIDNYGVVMGNVSLGGGANSFTNRAGGTFYSGATLDLGASSNVFTNEGTLVPGAGQLAQTTRISGSFRQTAAAVSDYEIDFATNAVDSVVATGNVDLAGRLNVSLLNTQAIKSGYHQLPIFQAGGVLTNNGIVLDAQPSIVIAYGLVFADNKTASVSYDVDFAPEGVVGNRIAIGRYINRMQDAGSSSMMADTIRTLVAQTQLDPYADLITQLGPEFYAEQQAHTVGSIQQFTRVMQNCGEFDVSGAGDDDVGCSWTRFDYQSSHKDLDEGFPRTEQLSHRYSQGFQYPSSNGWTYGLGVDFENNQSSGYGGHWSGDSNTLQLGLRARRDVGGGVTAGGVVTVGAAEQTVERNLAVTIPTSTYAQRHMSFLSGVFDVSQALKVGGFSVTPAFTLGLSALHGAGVRESGTGWSAGGQNLVLSSDTQEHSWVEPSVAFGYQTSFSTRAVLQAFARVSVVHFLAGHTSSASGGFAGAPVGLEGMRVVSDLDRTHFLGQAGVELVARRYSLSLAYSAEESEIRGGSTGTLRLVIPIH